MQNKVREYIKEYYNDKEITKSELNTLYSKKLIINDKTVNLADLLKFCTPYLPEDCKYSERLYHILNNIYININCPICNNNILKFINFNVGYYKSCSKSCYSKNIESKEKRKQTNLFKYGVDCNLKLESNKEKCKQTCIEKYGTENVAQSQVVKEKIKNTCIERYGVHTTLLVPEIQEKIKQTNIANLGVENPFYSKIVQDKIKISILTKYGVKVLSQNKEVKNKFKENIYNKLLLDTKRLNNCTPLFTFDEFKNNNVKTNYKFKWKCNICDTIFYDDLANGASPICPTCYKQYGSNLQKEIYSFLQTYNLDIRLNDRRFKFEIDILLENYNLGIEVNGNYWHSDLHGKDKYYHLNKTIETGKSNITLLHIFEDDWKFRQDIVKNIILDKLGLITNTVDNLSIYKITDEMSAEFLNNNCIHGNIKDNTNIIHYGLCDSSDIYYLISIQDNNIIRYCSKLNYKVNNDDISKLISHICRENNLDNLTVYCDLRYDSGELFKDLNFNYLKFKYPTYDFIHIKDYNTRIDKDNLIFENYDDKLSIWYNAMNNNYDRIWNCGYIIYEYKL